MVAVFPLDASPPPAEQRMRIRSTWKEYRLCRDIFDGPGLRMTYLNGVLELMSPSSDHELWKKNTARFVEHFAFLRDIPLHGYGSTTFKSEVMDRGCEPDECYLIGKTLATFPEIVLEVVHTSPLVDKLEVYRAFAVAEVWVFRNGAFTIHRLDSATGNYAIVSASELVPGLDFETLARFVVRSDTPDALREFDRLVRASD